MSLEVANKFKHKYNSIIHSYNSSAKASFKDGACKDITVGDCALNDDSIIQTIQLPMSVDICQETCFEFETCTLFQHTPANCTLFTRDYRQECKSAGGPPVIMTSITTYRYILI